MILKGVKWLRYRRIHSRSKMSHFVPSLPVIAGRDSVACNAGVPVRGEQKAAAGEGEGLKNGEGGGEGGLRFAPLLPFPLPRRSFLLASNGNACVTSTMGQSAFGRPLLVVFVSRGRNLIIKLSLCLHTLRWIDVA